METQTLNGQKKKIGHLLVKWSLLPNQNFSVGISREVGATQKRLKEWEFEKSPISEAVSFCWFDYVVRSVEQQYVMGIRTVPEFLMSASDSDAEKLILMVLERLA